MTTTIWTNHGMGSIVRVTLYTPSDPNHIKTSYIKINKPVSLEAIAQVVSKEEAEAFILLHGLKEHSLGTDTSQGIRP